MVRLHSVSEENHREADLTNASIEAYCNEIRKLEIAQLIGEDRTDFNINKAFIPNYLRTDRRKRFILG